MRILIVKTSALGDIIHTFAVVEYLRDRFPQGVIDWVVEAPLSSLVKAHPAVNQTLLIDTKKWRKALWRTRQERKIFRKHLREKVYDVVFDLQGNLKSSWVLLQARAKKRVGFGWKTVPEWPNIFFTSQRFNPPEGNNIRKDYLSVAQDYFRDSRPYAMASVTLMLTQEEAERIRSLFADKELTTLVCPGAAWPNKRLSVDTLLHLLRKIDRGPYFFSWGTSEELEVANRLAAKLPKSRVLEHVSLPLLQHIMARCRLVIAMDSLPLHLCGTTNTASWSFFGPSSAEKYAPIGDQHTTFQGICPYGVQFNKRCPKLRTCPTGACLSEDQRFLELLIGLRS